MNHVLALHLMFLRAPFFLVIGQAGRSRSRKQPTLDGEVSGAKGRLVQ